MPLATLHNDLNDYLTLLKAKVTAHHAHAAGTCIQQPDLRGTHKHACLYVQLVEVINEDYGDYVSLSSRLVNVDGFVLRMRKPLVELKVNDWPCAL